MLRIEVLWGRRKRSKRQMRCCERRDERLTLCCIVLHTSLWEQQRNEGDADLIGHRRETEREKKDKERTVAPECLIAVRGRKKVSLMSGAASIF